MKNVKFTLGLALSMLFTGATVSNAAYDNTAPHDGSIKTTLSVKASEFYTKSSVWGSVEGVRTETETSLAVSTNYNPTSSQLKSLAKRDTILPVHLSWLYSGMVTNNSGKVCDYFFDEDDTSPTYREYVGSGLFYEHKVSDGCAKNRTWVALKMVEGLDVNPIIKRTITYGEWVYNADKKVNELVARNVAPIIETLTKSNATFKPYYDRETGVATFYYEEDILSLMEKHIIYSIDYQIYVTEIMGEPSGSESEGPIAPEVTIKRGVTIDAEDGILTVPSALSGTHYTASNKNFTFTVHSPNKITVATDRGRDNEGVKIVDNKNGTYTVTIIKVQQDLTVTIKSAKTESGTGEGGQTGNEAVAENKVWSANGTLYVNAVTPTTVSVYTVTGQLYKQVSVSGSYSTTLSKGLYIVQLNGKAYKVVL